MDKVSVAFSFSLSIKKELFNSPCVSIGCDRFKLVKRIDCFQGLIKG